MRHDSMHANLVRRTLREQGGWAIVTAMMVMSAMVIIGLAAVAFVDTESRSSQIERQGEARLNLTEGVLNTELYQLSHNWPTKADFHDCTTGYTADPCFTATDLKANFSAVDFNLDPTWTVQVRDDDAPMTTTPGICDPSKSSLGGYYSDAAILDNAKYDANGNCQLWVRAEGVLDGSKRVVVAKVRVDTRPVQFPMAPFVAGSFATGNNAGHKVIVDGEGMAGQVRCSGGADCVDYNGSQVSNPGQVVTGDPSMASSAIDPAMVDALRQTAKQNNTYYGSTMPAPYNQCPADPSGAVVFVEDLSCNYAAVNVNPVTKQGIFVINKGTLKITGNGDWYGAIYLVNAQQSSGVVFDMQGTATIHGGVFVDGAGAINIGSSGNVGNCAGCQANLIYDSTVFPPLQAYGTAGIIQNTWRELTAG